MTDILTSFLAVLLLAVSGFGLRRPRQSVPAPLPPSRLLAELTTLGQKIASHALRLKINGIVTQARTLLNFLQSQPDDTGQWQDCVRACLASAVAGARQFGKLSSHRTEPTDPAVVKFSGFLTALAETFTGISEELSGGGVAGLGTKTDAYKAALHSIDQAYPGIGRP